MKNTNMLKISFSLLFVLFTITTFSHPGGHYHANDGTIFNTWTLKNGDMVKGNFSMGNGNIMILEQEEGKLIKIFLSDLTPQDQKLAQFKIKKFDHLNEQYLPTLPVIVSQKNILNYANMLLSIALGVGFIFLTVFLFNTVKQKASGKKNLFKLAASFTLMILLAYSCKKSTENIVTVVTIPKTTSGFIDSAFTPYKPAISTSWDATYFHVSSNGYPAHNMMVGITSWQQQVPIPQTYSGSNSWSIPLQPEYAAVPLSTKTNFMKGAVAIAVNGIPIFNALNNRGEDSYLIGELDNWGGHCGKGDDYHYHAAPMHLSTTSGLLPIAFALDGFAVYGSKEPNGTTMTSLDTCHGHIGTNGVYHYHGTTNYPYVIGAMKGKVTTDPLTPAPENQILPQAFATPLRPATSPLSGASITAFVSTGTNAYKLTYQRGTKFGYVDYSWNATNKYTFIFKDTAGVTTTSIYQR
jgi:hypothetical protein